MRRGSGCTRTVHVAWGGAPPEAVQGLRGRRGWPVQHGCGWPAAPSTLTTVKRELPPECEAHVSAMVRCLGPQRNTSMMRGTHKVPVVDPSRRRGGGSGVPSLADPVTVLRHPSLPLSVATRAGVWGVQHFPKVLNAS